MRIRSTVLSVMAMMTGMAGVSSALAADPHSIPYSIAMTSQDDLDTWTLYDVDGNVEGEKANWHIAKPDMSSDPCASSWTDATTFKDTDNWMTSPGITLEAGTQYVLAFNYYTSYNYDEKLDVLISRAPEQDAPHTTVKELTLTSGYTGYYGSSQKVMLPEITESGTYYITLRHHAAGTGGMVVFVKDISVDVLGYGSLVVKAQVYDRTAYGYVPVAGANVTAEGPMTFTAQTDEEGAATFTDIPAGSYKVTLGKFGYKDSYPTSYNVEAGQTATPYAVTMTPLDKDAVVVGAVTDNADNPVEGARVTLSGYDTYTASTDAEGKFRIEGIYYEGYYGWEYDLHVEKNNFVKSSARIAVKKNYYDPECDAGTVKLAYNREIAPASIAADTDDSHSVVTWERPVDNRRFAIDNGEAASSLGFSGSYGTNFLGVVYKSPAKVNRISWFRKSIEDTEEPAQNVNIMLIDLDENGLPTGEALFTAENVASPLDEWTSYTLPSSVEAPRGFMVAMSAIGHMSLGKDSNEEAVSADCQYYGNSWGHFDSYRTFADAGWTGALMLRADAEMLETGEFKPEIKYNLYRFEEGQEPGEPIAAQTEDLSYADEAWSALGQGRYIYAVEAVYPVDGLTSPKVQTEPIEHRMYTAVTVNVTTDSDPADAEGASVRLDDGAGHVYSGTVAEGKSVFEKVYKNNYTLSVSHAGFESEPSACDFTAEDKYEASVSLKQILAPVANIDAETSVEGTLVSWDLFADIEESFEGDDFPDFEINPAGRMGWSYIDNDGLPTYGFGQTVFPGMREPMAAIVMNSQATTPELKANVARTGKRALACFAPIATETSEGLILHKGDDYIISPRLDFHTDFTLSFYARTYEDIEGRLEKIRVGYSKTTPDLEEFVFDSGFESVPYSLSEFKHYEFDFPKDVRYVVINSSSDDTFMLLIDDIYIGTGITHSGKAPSAGKFNGYTIYLDGDKVADKTENSHYFEGLAPGQHTAEVEKRYNAGVSERLAVTFNQPSGIEGVNAEGNISIMTDGRTLTVNGSYDSASVWSASGQLVMDGISGNDAVSLASLVPGVYIVKASAKGTRGCAAKIVVK